MKKEIQLQKGLLETSSIQEMSANTKNADSLFSFNEVASAILNNKQKKGEDNKFYIPTESITPDPNRELPEIPTANGGIRVRSKSGKGEIVEAIPQIPYIKNEEVHFQYYPLNRDIKRQYLDKETKEIKKAHGLSLKDASNLTKDILNSTPAIVNGSVATRKGSFLKKYSNPKNILKFREKPDGTLIGITAENLWCSVRMFSNVVNSKNCIGVAQSNPFIKSAEDKLIRIPFTAEAKTYTTASFIKSEIPNSQIKIDIVNKGEGISGNAKVFSLHPSWNYIYFTKELEAKEYDLIIQCPVNNLTTLPVKIAGLTMEEGFEPSSFDFRCVSYGTEEIKTLPHPLIFKLPLESSSNWFLTYKRKIYLNLDNTYSGENEDHLDSLGPFKWGYRNGRQIVLKVEDGKETEISPKATPAILSIPSTDFLKEKEDIWETVEITLNRDANTSINNKYILNIKIYNDPAESINPTIKVEYEIPIDIVDKTIDALLSNTMDTVVYNLALGSECVDSKDGISIKTYNGMYKDLYFLDITALQDHKNALKTLMSVDLEEGSDNPILRIENIKEI